MGLFGFQYFWKMKGLNLFWTLILVSIIVPKDCIAKLGSSRLHEEEQKDTLTSIRNQDFIIQLNAREFRKFVFATPRNYSTFVLFYKEDRNNRCPECSRALDAFYRIAMTFYKNTDMGNAKMESVFFAVIHMGEELKKLKTLKIDPTRPNFYYFPQSVYKKYNPYSKMEQYISNGQSEEHVIAKWINDVSGIFINLRFAFENSNGSSNTLMALTLCGIFVFCFWRHGEKLGAKPIYEIICEMNYNYFIVLIVIWLISGQMFNQIRGTGLAMRKSDGGIVLIHPSKRNQLIGESYIIMGLYAVMCYTLVKLIEIKETQVLEKKPFSEVSNRVVYSATGFLCAFVGIVHSVNIKDY